MSERPYLLATERSDLAFGNLRDGITGEPGSIWRLAPAVDAMAGAVFVFVAGPHHLRTDDLSIVKVSGVAKYLRDDPEPYYQILPRLRDGSFDRYGAQAKASELWPLCDEVEIKIDCSCCGQSQAAMKGRVT